MSMQIFLWSGAGQQRADNKVHYQSFTLNNVEYQVGDCVFLYPEDEQYPPYIARILSAFVDNNVQYGSDPHCIEVKWFERRVNLEPSTKGIEESEREVFELEDTDINPIGCISGKCRIMQAFNYEEARIRCGDSTGWFFCRGYFQQSTNSFVAYSPAEMDAREGADGGGQEVLPDMPPALPSALPPQAHTRGPSAVAAAAAAAGSSDQAQPPTPTRLRGHEGSGAGAGVAAATWANGADEDEDEEEEPEEEEDMSEERPRNHRRPTHAQHHHPPAQQQPPNKKQKATGRTCVECGATSTPQWREGPMGPKTLCNACGVRYVRSQQKAAGQKRSSGAHKNGQKTVGADQGAATGKSVKAGHKSKGQPKRAAD